MYNERQEGLSRGHCCTETVVELHLAIRLKPIVDSFECERIEKGAGALVYEKNVRKEGKSNEWKMNLQCFDCE